MPKPHYIICCEEVSLDRDTGRVSHYFVIEKFVFTAPPVAKSAKKSSSLDSPLALCVDSVWEANRDDLEGKSFEAELLLKFTSKTPIRIAKTEFQFTDRLHRHLFKIRVASTAPAGNLSVISRVRPVGTKRWLGQQFKILIEST